MLRPATDNASRTITEPVLRTMLASLGASDIDHHGRSLSEHLVGTWRLLTEWRNAPMIAVAGGFHSIYGTEEFKTKALPLSERSRVAAMIGAKAEELAYLFGAADRRGLFNAPDAEPVYVFLPATGETVLIDGSAYSSLIEIEAANIVEQAMHQQGVPNHVVRFWLQAFESRRHCLSAAAMVAIESVLAGYSGSTPGSGP
ncbi:DUF6817 domain-containing protein [Cupriavidus metallidurans]|uniref:DUF6817 domain-containing protein n=1 Tax=Cupriavidus metallidurans TaxID=119219 RepID=UPI001BFC19BC|nr:hypothetical protein [Cupriavidus metallidurans]QWC91234.1 hypothetical protein KB891_27445 [Cupriavidus metallidurans]